MILNLILVCILIGEHIKIFGINLSLKNTNNIFTIGLVDSNANPNEVDIAIPANDDGQKNTQVMLNSGQCQQNSMINHTKQFNEGSFLFPNGRKVNLSGLNDWFIPSTNEMQPLGSMRSSIIFENKQFGSSLWETMLDRKNCATSSVDSNGYQSGVNWMGYIIRPISGGSGIITSDLCLVRKFR